MIRPLFIIGKQALRHLPACPGPQPASSNIRFPRIGYRLDPPSISSGPTLLSPRLGFGPGHAGDPQAGRPFAQSSGHSVGKFPGRSDRLDGAGDSLVAAPQKSGCVQWLGDKKPLQHTDPNVLKFLLQHFPEAHFLHIVRHPFDVAASSDRFNQTADGDFWLGLSTAEKVERWAYHEQQVLSLHRDLSGRCHSLRYEDFCRQTRETLTAIFAFFWRSPRIHRLLSRPPPGKLIRLIAPSPPCLVPPRPDALPTSMANMTFARRAGFGI